ncbi:putative sucrose utilization protein SUC1 [Colletotrichum orbiculare MAFF 240422]|uniref:Sucrose utilization protein SUC1 n=1 Tax=Colletotrichum orbiculare (strain 104-T / ATCC 96160 / CBS 514.97 / LARS 414 / MAFF 240422) TaxID=1213857 RepID=N4W2F6_COLOR|nr:putative sucrose utilization protein SUC1 [Colletotrichum orbiculare MAFF 240422]
MDNRKTQTRISNPCDGCSLRRVRCTGGTPCNECRKRSLECTFMRIQRKRGPKGPRSSTSAKVAQYQEQIRQDQQLCPENQSSPSPSCPYSTCSGVVPAAHQNKGAARLPLELYIKYLERFRDGLACVWPVVDVGSLVSRLVSNAPDDHEAFALAGAVCAAVIVQIRLSQLRTSKSNGASPNLNDVAEGFARHSQYLRDQYDYRESESTDSLLTAFFLHIYFTNTDRTRAGAVYLHEAIAQLSVLNLHRPETFDELSVDHRELMLRIFWLVFVTERTFCVQNGFPTCLSPIQTRPSEGYRVYGLGSLDSSFKILSEIFTLLDDTLLVTGERLVLKSDPRTADNLYRGLSAMTNCNVSTVGPTLPELQRVNVMVTWNWIHILWWQYALRHYRMSSNMGDAMLSMLRPASVAHETVSLFASVSPSAIQAHGYGLELKIFRIADSLVDLLACNRHLPGVPQPGGNAMLLGARDTLHALQNTLLLIGGQESFFYQKLQLFMAEVQLPVPDVRALLASPHGRGECVADGVPDEVRRLQGEPRNCAAGMRCEGY